MQQAPLVKVLVVGAAQVGKTSLVQRYVFDEFLEVAPTVGVNFAQKLSVGVTGPLNMSIWDLSGQPRFRFLMPHFCSGASAVVLVTDLTQLDALEDAAGWLELVSRRAHSLHHQAIVLAGSKWDLASQIPQKELRVFCNAHNISAFVPYSAKTGFNVDRVFAHLTRALQRAHLELPCQKHDLYSAHSV